MLVLLFVAAHAAPHMQWSVTALAAERSAVCTALKARQDAHWGDMACSVVGQAGAILHAAETQQSTSLD